MIFNRSWTFRWVIVLALGATVAVWSASRGDERPAASGKVEHANLDFTLKDMDGRDVKLSDFKGRPLVLNFWATWCAPCKDEIPGLIALADKYREENVAVVGISIDDDPKDLKKFAAEFKMNYPVLVGLGRDEVLEAYEANFAIPVTWFVRPDGTVSLKHSGTQTKDWFEKQIKALF